LLKSANQFVTSSGIQVKRSYTEADVKEAGKETDAGKFPFTRGIYPSMYRDRLWTMRQYTGFGSAAETNRRFKFLIDHGQTGLSVAFDLPTQLGYDSDSRKAEGEVGKVGVPISSIQDMHRLFNGIKLKDVSTSMTINATSSIMLAMYFALGQSQGYSWNELRGTTQNDILKEYIARNTYIFPPRPSLKIAVDIIEFCAKNAHMWHPISISGYHIRESGADAVQELAYAFADAKAYVAACIERGLQIDDFAPHLSFFFACQNEFLEEIAKFRAARRIWAHIMKNEYHATNPESMKLRFHAQTSGETLTAQQPMNNIIRVTIQALAAVLGGTQSLHTNSLDEALSLPTEEAVKIALRTQQLIAYETGIAKTVDPLGGSFCVEHLTDQIEKNVFKELEKIKRMGGTVEAIQKGYVQSQIRESAYKQQREVDSGSKKVVGVNVLVDRDVDHVRIQKIKLSETRNQIARVREFKHRRDMGRVDRSLERMRKALEDERNIMPFMVNAVKSKATTGEISDLFREIFGEFHPATAI
jgi:methylmalonyl-CoA mutase N-terminal domain/subunit